MLIMTSAIGKFTFDEGASLSLAKIIRDGVTSQIMFPKPREPRIETVEQAQAYARSWESNLVAGIQFDLEFNEVGNSMILETKLRELAHQGRVTARTMEELVVRFQVTVSYVRQMLKVYRGQKRVEAVV